MRENTEYIRPPRALWVPFDLGRPLGTPDEPEFQREVVRAALALLTRQDGPVILQDFPHDAPGQGDPDNMAGLVCPVPLRKPDRSAAAGDLVAAVEREIAQLAPWAALFRTERKRSSVGVSKMPLEDGIAFLADLITTGQSTRVPEADWPATLRFVTEDLRNYYLEAAAMRPGGAATTAERVDWFWGETSAGRLFFALAAFCANHADEALRNVPIIPRSQRHRAPSAG